MMSPSAEVADNESCNQGSANTTLLPILSNSLVSGATRASSLSPLQTTVCGAPKLESAAYVLRTCTNFARAASEDADKRMCFAPAMLAGAGFPPSFAELSDVAGPSTTNPAPSTKSMSCFDFLKPESTKELR